MFEAQCLKQKMNSTAKRYIAISASTRGYDNKGKKNLSVICTYRPKASITELMRITKFQKDELQHLYRSFKQECPAGTVTKEKFTSVFSVMFPNGASYRYISFLFQNIDRDNDGIITFEEFVLTLSLLAHGTIEDRLSWVFNLYDVNKDGKISRRDLAELIESVFNLMIPARKLDLVHISNNIEQRTNDLFEKWDVNRNGVISLSDFLMVCLQDDTMMKSMNALNNDIFSCIEIRKCYNVTIVFGSIEITLKITDCKNVSISVVCRRLVINQCRSSSFYILIPTGPLMIVGPDGFYPLSTICSEDQQKNYFLPLPIEYQNAIDKHQQSISLLVNEITDT
ncbi:unnamed protein product [Didymodactylos carnosus]|uniref:EF-hand domain-containing protein n=2 Tax=Didymodactylos carnosus TaxID=1234261 RepID=A0A813S222_9BILA|nr:unnamed protein product [Didymodactylos carnosus]CAF3574314.1 unnamed protein product [Didymodactylos carnosus]